MLKRIEDIRRRMSNDYIFDEPGEAIISMDEDMEWALGEIELLHELFLMAFRYWMGEEFGPAPTDKEMYTKLAEIEQRKTCRVAGG